MGLLGFLLFTSSPRSLSLRTSPALRQHDTLQGAEEETRSREILASCTSLEFKLIFPELLPYLGKEDPGLMSPFLWALPPLVLSPFDLCTCCALLGCPFLLCLPGKLLLSSKAKDT